MDTGAHRSGIQQDREAWVTGAPGMGGGPLVQADSQEAQIAAAVVVCASRWGIAKTTVDDIAREAGLSRATVYRLFPGGKPSVVSVATRVEAISMLSGLLNDLRGAKSLRDALVVLLHGGFVMIDDHPALAYMRDHDPATLSAFMSFDRLSELLITAADLLSPALHPHLDPETATEVVTWAGRVVVSHYTNPDPEHSLGDPAFAQKLVDTFFLPVLVGNQDADKPTHKEFHP